ncbi:MAG: Rrf2 family transcriptional regulator [bacterium]|nr:Rrf2 family transcriptional regulator [bacterium]
MRGCAARRVAAATGIPVNYLSKILNQLRKAGLVESRKGWGGGFQLRRMPGSDPSATCWSSSTGSKAPIATTARSAAPPAIPNTPAPCTTSGPGFVTASPG